MSAMEVRGLAMEASVVAMAVEMVDTIRRFRPNLAVNRTPAGGAGHGEHLVDAGYLGR
jgi:hypothetical protein